MIIKVLSVKIVNIYGPAQIFISLAVILLGMHVVILASIETIPETVTVIAFVGILAAVFTIGVNFRKSVR